MQPIAQIGLDPTEDHIRHMRADQEFRGMLGGIGLITAKTTAEPVCQKEAEGTKGGVRRLLLDRVLVLATSCRWLKCDMAGRLCSCTLDRSR